MSAFDPKRTLTALCLIFIASVPNLPIGFVDRAQMLAEARRLVDWKSSAEGFAKHVEVSLRQQADGNNTIRIHCDSNDLPL